MDSFSFRANRRKFLSFLSGASVGAPVLASATRLPDRDVSGIIFPDTSEIVIPPRDPFFSASVQAARNQFDIQPDVLWDTIYPDSVPNNGQNFMLFNGPGYGSDYRQHKTNMQMCQMLPAPQQMLIYQIVVSGCASDLRGIGKWIVRFWVGGKRYVERPIASMRQSDMSAYYEFRKETLCLIKNTVFASAHFKTTGGLAIPMQCQFSMEVIPDRPFEEALTSKLVLPREYTRKGPHLCEPVQFFLDGLMARSIQ